MIPGHTPQEKPHDAPRHWLVDALIGTLFLYAIVGGFVYLVICAVEGL